MDDRANRIIADVRALGVETSAEPEKKPPPDLTDKFEKCGIPPRYRKASFEALGRDGCPEDVRELAVEAYQYAKNLEENLARGKGLLFFGEVGRMKTTLAVCIAREAIEQGKTVYFISMPELLDKLITMSKNKDSQELLRFQHKIEDVPLLILDDFGAEYPNDWVLNKVDSVITHRYNYEVSTIITTNMLPGEIKARYVQRVYDRLRSTNKALGTSGDSLRKTAE